MTALTPREIVSELDAKSIATEALGIAGDICIYTNRNIVVEQL